MWEYDPKSEARDPASETELAKLHEELRVAKLKVKVKDPVKRLFGYHVPWAGSDCESCVFRGCPHFEGNKGRCMIFESPLWQKARKMLPSPAVTTDCPYFVTIDELVVRASDHSLQKVLLDNLRAKVKYLNNGGKREFVDPREEAKYIKSVRKQKKTRSFLSSLETIGWWNTMDKEVRKLVVNHIFDEKNFTVHTWDWERLGDWERRVLLKWRREYLHTLYKRFIKQVEDKGGVV